MELWSNEERETRKVCMGCQVPTSAIKKKSRQRSESEDRETLEKVVGTDVFQRHS